MYLGIDFGKKRIGLAVGQKLPKAIGFLDGSKPIDFLLEEIMVICQKESIEEIVIGIPKMDHKKSELEDEIRSFAKKMGNKMKLPVRFEEEQFTSLEAKRIFMEQGRKIESKEKIDQLSAILILEQFISRRELSGGK